MRYTLLLAIALATLQLGTTVHAVNGNGNPYYQRTNGETSNSPSRGAHPPVLATENPTVHGLPIQGGSKSSAWRKWERNGSAKQRKQAPAAVFRDQKFVKKPLNVAPQGGPPIRAWRENTVELLKETQAKIQFPPSTGKPPKAAISRQTEKQIVTSTEKEQPESQESDKYKSYSTEPVVISLEDWCRVWCSGDPKDIKDWTATDLKEREKYSTEMSYVAERVCLYKKRLESNDHDDRDVKTVAERILLPEDSPLPFYKNPPAQFRLPILPEKKITIGPQSLASLLLATRREQVSPNSAKNVEKQDTPAWKTVHVVTQQRILISFASDKAKCHIKAQKVGGTLFLMNVPNETCSAAEITVDKKGHQFERACKVDSPSTLTETDPDLQTNRLVTKGNIGKFQILLESEIDAVDLGEETASQTHSSSSKIPLEKLKIIELKSRTVGAWREKRTQRLELWLQFILAGMDETVLGIFGDRTEKDVLVTLSTGTAKQVEDAEKTMLFAKIEQVLEFLVENVKEGSVYLFERLKGTGNEGTSRFQHVLRIIPSEHSFVDEKMLTEVEKMYPAPLLQNTNVQFSSY